RPRRCVTTATESFARRGCASGRRGAAHDTLRATRESPAAGHRCSRRCPGGGRRRAGAHPTGRSSRRIPLSAASCVDPPHTPAPPSVLAHRRTPTLGRTLRRRSTSADYSARETTSSPRRSAENASPTPGRPPGSPRRLEKTACASRRRYTVAPWAVLLSRPGACVLEPRHYLRRRDWATALSSDQSAQRRRAIL